MTLGVWEGARQHCRRIDIRLAIDISAEPLSVYRDNFDCDSSRVRCDDVARLFNGGNGQPATSNERYWKGKLKDLDLIVAGPPCQGHSDLNNSTRRNDPRNGLYLRVTRAAEILRPKAVIIENVPQVLLDKRRVISRAVKSLKKCGYYVSEDVIQFARFGVPQLRKRHILTAVQNGTFDLSELEDVPQSGPTVGEYLGDMNNGSDSSFSRPSEINSTNKARIDYLFDNELYDLPDKMRPPCHRDREHAYVSMYGRMYWDKPAQTLTSGFGSMGQGRYVHPKERRLLTPHEAARLQGIPDFFDFSAAATLTGLREMIANAVPPPFTSCLVSRLIRKRLL